MPVPEVQGTAYSTDGAHSLWAFSAAFTTCNLIPNAPQFCSTRSIRWAAVPAHMPAADFPSPSKCIAVNHQWGFAFHFPSALDCVTKPPDSPPLTTMFYNTADQIQTTNMPYNKKQTEQMDPHPSWGLGRWNQKHCFLCFTKIWKRK